MPVLRPVWKGRRPCRYLQKGSAFHTLAEISKEENPVGDMPPEQTDLPATLPPSVVKREGPVGYELSRSDDEVDNGRVGVSVSERRSPQVRSVTRR